MPTGYTAAVEDGEITTLEEFALRCARAFGATITMRDDKLSKPIPERFEPETSYYDEKLEEAKARLAELSAMNPAQAAEKADEEFAEKMASHNQYEADRALRNERHRAMLQKVQAWKVPEELDELKKFMVNQLEMSISEYHSPAPVPQTWKEWLNHEIADAVKDIESAETSIKEEIERVEGRNQWLATLRKSLQPKEPEKRKMQL